MTVDQLREELSQYPGDFEVVDNDIDSIGSTSSIPALTDEGKEHRVVVLWKKL